MSPAAAAPGAGPLVSIGVASFNNAAYIIDTLESIRAQTYPHWELVVVDDASKDNSAELITDWLKTHPEVNGKLLVNSPNRGVCHTFNRFLDAAQGKYISIIGSDDLFLPDKLTAQVALLEAAPGRVGVVYSDVSKIDPAGKVIVPSVYDTGQIRPFSGDIWLEMLKTNFLGAMTVLIRRECFDKVGHFDEDLAYEDWDMWLRIAREYDFLYQPEITCHYRIHGASALHKRRAQIIETNLRLLQKHLGVSPEGDAIIARHLREFSEQLYLLGSPDSVKWLRRSWQQHRHTRGLALLLAARLGVPAATVAAAFGVLKRLTGQAGPDAAAAH
ncbi:glycosyltransferase [Hymenobacter armeniacus]|uniref:Glycosyltransferase n=1 Tax=Hymenobacter armeniacus TaxID=2771358 RepID=A0ABR8JSK8_9BACT|nr:glycosyltransferase [Hymenobacter armeniacus]MBD2721786.1 glycosyltransferase [Hymenobacter armeniacus]